MRIASFDIGKRNFALCVEEDDRIILLENHDLTSRGDDLIPIMLEMTRVLSSHNDIFDRCNAFLVEQQMFFGKSKNVMAVKLGQHCLSYFITRYGVLRDIQEFPAFHKTRVYNAPKMTKPQRKKWAIDKSVQVLSDRSDPFLTSLLTDFKKKDDVADTILHIQAYKILIETEENHYNDKDMELKSEALVECNEATLLKLKNAKLKKLCKERGLPVSGTKQQLVDRLTGKKTDKKTKACRKGKKTKKNTVHTNSRVILKRLEENRILYNFTRNGDGFYCWQGWCFNEVKQVVDYRVVNGHRRLLTTEDMLEAKSIGLPIDLSVV